LKDKTLEMVFLPNTSETRMRANLEWGDPVT